MVLLTSRNKVEHAVVVALLQQLLYVMENFQLYFGLTWMLEPNNMLNIEPNNSENTTRNTSMISTTINSNRFSKLLSRTCRWLQVQWL